MKVKHGKGKTKYGPGVQINLTGQEVAMAIQTYLVAHGAYIDGPRTIYVNGELCGSSEIYVDPCGSVVYNGSRYKGTGEVEH